MRMLLLPVLALSVACETTEDLEVYVNLTGSYEGHLNAVYGGTVSMEIRINQVGDTYTGNGVLEGELYTHPRLTVVPWDEGIRVQGTVAPGYEPAITMEIHDGCSTNEVSGVVSGFAIVVHGAVLPAGGDCSPPERRIDVIGRLERLE